MLLLSAATLAGSVAANLAVWKLSTSITSFEDSRGNASAALNFMTSRFGQDSRAETIISTPKVPGESLLRKDVLSDLFDVLAAAKAATVTGPNSHVVTYEDVCERMYGSGCSYFSPTSFWPSKQAMLNDPDIGLTVGACTGAVPCTDSTSDTPIVADYVLGKGYRQERVALPGGRNATNVTHVPAMIASLFVAAPGPSLPEGTIALWEQQGFVASAEAHPVATFQKFVLAQSSLEAGIVDEAHADVAVIALSYAAMTAYLLLALSGWHSLTGVRVSVVAACMAGVVGAASLAAALVSLLGVQCNVIVLQVFPFLLMAIGVDSTFQLVDAVDRAGPRTALPAAVVAAVTDPLPRAVAFAAAATVPFEAMQQVCIYCAMGMVCTAVAQVAVVAPVLALEVRWHHSRPSRHPATSSLRRWLSVGMSRFYLRMAQSRPLQLSIVAGWVALSGAVAWWLAAVRVDFDPTDLLPSSSPTNRAIQAQISNLGLGPPVYFVVDGRSTNFSALGTRAALGRVGDAMRSSDWTVHEDTFDWVADYEWMREYCPASFSGRSWAAGARGFLYAPASELCGTLLRPRCPEVAPKASCPPFLQPTLNGTAGACASPFALCSEAMMQIRQSYRGNVVFDTIDNGTDFTISASRQQTYFLPLDTTQLFVGAMRAAWGMAASAQPELPDVMTASVFMPFYEQYIFIVDLTIGLFCKALVALLALHVCFLFRWRSSLVLLVAVALVTVSAASTFSWTGVNLNSTTAVNLVAGMGIAIELCVHILRFATSEACPGVVPEQRVVAAMSEAGATTLTGIALTKLVGLAVLAAAPSRITRVYFLRPFLAVVAVGTLYALLVVPAALLAAPILLDPTSPRCDDQRARPDRKGGPVGTV